MQCRLQIENNMFYISVTLTPIFGGLTPACCCCTDSKGSACAALPESQRFQPWQGQGAVVPVAHLEEAAPGRFPARHMGAAATASGLLLRRLAPSRQRYGVKDTSHRFYLHFISLLARCCCAAACLQWTWKRTGECKDAEGLSLLHLSRHGRKQPVNYWLKTLSTICRSSHVLKMSHCF